MNEYLILITVIIVFGYVLDLTVELLNVKAIDPKLPEEFKGYYDDAKYAKSQKYLKENTRFSLISSSVNFAVLLTVIYAGIFGFFDSFVRSFNHGEIITGVIFAVLIMFANKLINISFSVYDTFVIEEKYGFNKTTPKTFVLDLVKGFLISVVISGLMLAAVIWFFTEFGKIGWVYVWAAITVFELFISYIAPVVIMPLFNKFEPLEDGELRSKIENYAKEYKFKLKGIYKMDGSKRSTKANAFFTGFGKYKRIVLYDTLIKKMNADEILAVLAHEMGHFKKRHIVKSIIMSTIHTGVMLFVFSLFLGNEKLVAAFGFQSVSIYAGLLAFGILFSPINMLVSVFENKLSRRFEYQADKYVFTTLNTTDHLITGLKKLSSDSLSNLTPHKLKVMFDYSHPPILKRIKTLREISK